MDVIAASASPKACMRKPSVVVIDEAQTSKNPDNPGVKPRLKTVIHRDALSVTNDPSSSSRIANQRRDATKLSIAELLSLMKFWNLPEK
jgi:hypothetical protein